MITNTQENEDYKSYTILSQINYYIYTICAEDERYLEKLLQKTKNIDYQIPAKGKFVLHTNEKLIGKTALHLTCKDYWHQNEPGKCKSIRTLLKYNADTTIKDALGLTALLGLVEDGYESKNWICEGSFACGCISSLLSAQVASNKHENPCNKYGLSHFHIACMAKHSEAVQFFLKHDVDVDQKVRIDSPVFSGYTPLHFAVSSCALQTVEMLVESGADLHLKNADGFTPVHQLLKHSVDLFNKLHIYRKSSKPSIKNLLADIDVNEKIMNLFLKNFGIHQGIVVDEFGIIIVHLACTLKTESLMERILMDDAVNINQTIDANSPVCPGFTPLHLAAMFNLDIAMILLKKGANPTIKDAKGQSPLDIFLNQYSIKEIHTILSTQLAWKDIVMSDGKTKLLDLVYSMRQGTIFDRFVLQAHEQKDLFVPMDSPLWPGYTPLHLAVTFAERADVQFCKSQCSNVKDKKSIIKVNLSIVEKCLQWNPKAVIAQDAHDSTPIHLAFLAKKLKVVILLLGGCGLENPTNQDNLSHLHISCAAGYRGVVESLMTNADLNSPVGSDYVWFDYYMDGCKSKLKSFQIKSGWTPLHIALAGEHYEVAKLLLDGGADINATDDNGTSALHLLFDQYVARWSRKEIAFLWSHPDLKDVVAKDSGQSHLHVAVNQESAEAVKRLLKLGADPNAMISKELTDSHRLHGWAGCTPLHLLKVEDTKSKILGSLLKYGADVLAATRMEYSLLTEIFDTIECARVFVSYLKENEAEQKRVRESMGLTMLHLACCTLDLDLVQILLRNNKSDVNAQVHRNSRFWPGCTPLHASMLWNEIRCWQPDKDDNSLVEKSKNIVQLLLKNGANVASWSDKYGTPMHVAMLHSSYSSTVFTALTGCVNAMLDKYTDFTKNLVDRNGISLFHVACRMNAVRAAKKFLEHGVDANEPIDNFIGSSNYIEFLSFTPLHLCLTQQYSMKMIVLLLKYGANIHAENFKGDTPLHTAAINCQKGRRKIFKKLIAAGANVNAENVYGETPLGSALNIRKATAQEIEFFCERSHNPNYFNSVTQLGFMSNVFERGWNERNMWSLADALFNAPGFCEPDEMGRTALHNIVACLDSTLTHDQYVGLIEMLTDLGCAIDAQNKSGQTALHYAAHFLNKRAVSALLLAGADVNVVDDKGDTPYSCALKPYTGMYNSIFFVPTTVNLP